MGVCFVSFVSQYGYDRVLSVLGRHMRDFLNVIFQFYMRYFLNVDFLYYELC